MTNQRPARHRASKLILGAVALAMVAVACSERNSDDSASGGSDTTLASPGTTLASPDTTGGSAEASETAAASESATGAASDTTAAPSGDGDIQIIMVSGPLFDPFFAVKKGADDAASDLGVHLEYTTIDNADNVGPDFARLTQNAVTKSPDGLAVGNYFPDAQGPEIERGVSNGIPVVMVNGGEATWKETGALTYIGQDETLAGEQAAQAFVDAGAKNILCVNHVPGNPTVEARCVGVKNVADDNGVKSDILNIATNDANDPTAVASAIRGAIQADDSIDAVFTLGSNIAESALRAIADANAKDRVMVGTTDLSNNVLAAVADGSLMFAIDQQPYLQGYYAVQALTQYISYGLLPATPPRTGPLLITKDNVAAVQKANESGVRGAA